MYMLNCIEIAIPMWFVAQTLLESLFYLKSRILIYSSLLLITFLCPNFALLAYTLYNSNSFYDMNLVATRVPLICIYTD